MLDLLDTLLLPGRTPQLIEPALVSFIAAEEQEHHYDSKVKFYDALIGNPVYNRLIWGNWPSNYRDFCLTALNSAEQGPVLDVGCGSLVFTHKVYARYGDRPVLLLDRSLGMLLRAKERILEALGELPENLLFVHADALDLPFRDGSFNTLLSFGLLHIFDQPSRLLTEMLRVKTPEGNLFATSLVANNGLGQRYLGALKKAGEVGCVNSVGQLHQQLAEVSPHVRVGSIGNMAYVGLHPEHIDPRGWLSSR